MNGLSTMKQLTLIQKLDEVLHYIKTGTEFGSPLTFESIYKEMGSKYPEQIGELELKSMINKLEKDKYLEIKSSFYYITFEGSFFEIKGGYQQEIDEANRVSNLEQRNSKLQFIIAAGTSIAALYYLNELSNAFHFFCFCK